MKIFIPNYQPDRIGGGWTWTKYFVDYFGQSSYEEAEIFMIPSASMVERNVIQQAKNDGKKIVLRTDNVLRNSRNRNTGMTRLYDFAKWADLVIYQSEWAKKFLMPFLEKDGTVILNGVDTELYNANHRSENNAHSYLYARSSRDEGKQWINSWYWFVEQYANQPESTLEIVGKFSPENLEYNFDFYNGEKYRFMGEQKSLVDSYRRNRYFLYSFTNDACSNTLLEAKASGCLIVDVYGALKTGGAPEIMACKDISIERCMKEYEVALCEL